MSCFAVATVGVRVPTAVLQEILNNANAMSSIANKFGALLGEPAKAYTYSNRISILAGLHTLEISNGTWFIVGQRGRQIEPQMKAYIEAMAIAVRQQQIAAALGQIAKVTNDKVDKDTFVRTISVRM